MKGWVTWCVAGLTAAYAVAGYAFGLHGADKMADLLIVAGGLVGIGRKLDRNVSPPE
jgi:hypothetical protein